MASRVPFPNRYYAAVGFAANPPLGARAVSDETRLLLYALYQQVTAGPCRAAKPWGWNAVESAKWSSWTQLGDTPKLDAMRMYVSTMEEENPDWFDLVTDGGDPDRVAEVLEHAADAVAAAAAAEEASADPSLGKPATGSASDQASLRAARFEDEEAVTPRRDPSVDRIAAEDGTWAQISSQISGKFPRGRYAHAVAVVGSEVFVIGGNSRGRKMRDVHALDLNTMTWHQPKCETVGEGEEKENPPDAEGGASASAARLVTSVSTFAPRSGHAAVTWGSKILVVGGHRDDDAFFDDDDASEEAGMDVWQLETESAPMEWRRVRLGGDPPPRARGGHTATLVRGSAGTKIVVFGGEDRRGRLLDDVHFVDLQTMRWVSPADPIPGAAPAARAGHVAAAGLGVGAQAVTDVFVFGGVASGSAGEVSGELFVLDTMAMTWKALDPAGPVPVPRAGAAGAVVGNSWYIAGGGGPDGGRRDTVALRRRLGGDGDGDVLEWTSAAEVAAGSSLAAEGLGLVAVGGGAALLAFGGYDGARYSSDVHVLKRPTAGRLAMTKTKMLSPVRASPSRRSAEEARASEELQGPARRASGDAGRPPRSPASASSPDPVALARELERTKAQLADARAALAETRRALEEERAESARLAKATQERTESEPARPKGVWGFLSGDAPEYRRPSAA
jgi:acyl-CoA-binding protein